MIFVYCDGASRGNPGPAAFGVHIEDESGNTIADFGEGLGYQTNNYAEYQGIIAALRYLTSTEYRDITIRLDSKLVVEQLSGRWKVKSPDIRELVIEASELLGAFNVELQWIPREQNSAADALANRALDQGDFQTIEASLELSGIQPRSIRAPRQTNEPTTLVVIRHGSTAQTEANLIAGGDTQGPELSPLGLQEAEAAAGAISPLLEKFGLPPAEIIIHSPLVRTQQTAAAIGKSLGLDLAADERLREIQFGNWDGLSMTELEIDSSAELAKWRSAIDFAPPAGESVSDLSKRVESIAQELISAHQGKTVVIITHMMPARGIARFAQKSSMDTYWNLNLAPCGISVYRFFGSNFAETFTVNSCAHLIAS